MKNLRGNFGISGELEKLRPTTAPPWSARQIERRSVVQPVSEVRRCRQPPNAGEPMSSACREGMCYRIDNTAVAKSVSKGQNGRLFSHLASVMRRIASMFIADMPRSRVRRIPSSISLCRAFSCQISSPFPIAQCHKIGWSSFLETELTAVK